VLASRHVTTNGHFVHEIQRSANNDFKSNNTLNAASKSDLFVYNQFSSVSSINLSNKSLILLEKDVNNNVIKM
jgi:hypothetical protein